jgi:hypothetical protein
VLQNLPARVRQQYVPPYAIALVNVGLGDKDRAFRCLQDAIADRSTSMVFLRSDPALASLGYDPVSRHFHTL